MKWWLLALFTPASLFLCVAQDQRKPKPQTLEVVELQLRRNEDKILIDGKLRNNGDSKLRGVEMTFYFLSSDKKVVSTRRFALDEDELAPGDEAALLLETAFPARTVSMRMEARGRGERWINLSRSGPFLIE